MCKMTDVTIKFILLNILTVKLELMFVSINIHGRVVRNSFENTGRTSQNPNSKLPTVPDNRGRIQGVKTSL